MASGQPSPGSPIMLAAGTRAPSKMHLAELLGDPVDHLQRPLLDAGLAHRHRERRDALVLRHVVVGAGEEQAPLGVVGVAGPHLVAGEHVLVAVAVGPGAQRGEVGAGVGLAEALAPAVAPVDDARAGTAAGCPRCRARGCPAPGSRGSAGAARRPAPAPRRGSRRRRSAARGRRCRSATTCRRSRRRRATGATPPAPPSSRRRSTRPAGRGCWSRARCAAGPGTPASSGESPKSMRHPRLVVSDPVVGEHPVEARVRRRRGRRSTAAPGAGGRGPGTPTCCRCRRAPGWRSRTPCGRPARSRPWPARRRPAPRDGGRASTAHAAWRATLREPSMATYASASRCCTAWNEPMVVPYCWRDDAYSQARSTAPRIVPTRSAQVSASPRAVQRARSSSVSGRPSSGATSVWPRERHRRPGQVDGHRRRTAAPPDRPASRSARPRAPAPPPRPWRRRPRTLRARSRRPRRPGSQAGVERDGLGRRGDGGTGQPPELGGERRPEEGDVGQAAARAPRRRWRPRRPTPAGHRSRRRCAARASRPRRPRRRAWRPARRRRAGPRPAGRAGRRPGPPSRGAPDCSGERRTSISRPSGPSRAAVPTRRAACGAAPCRTGAAGWRRRRRGGAGACRWPASRRRAARARCSATGRAGSSCTAATGTSPARSSGEAEHRAVEHRRVAVQHGLDLGRRHLEAVDLDHLLRAVGEVDPALRLEPADVAGAVPAVGEGRRRSPRRGGTRPSPRGCAPGSRRPRPAGSASPVSRSTTRSSTSAGGRPAESSRQRSGRSTGLAGDHRQLARAVGREPADAGALRDHPGHALAHRRGAPHDVAERREVEVLEPRVVRHRERDRRDRHLEGHALGLDAAQQLVEVEPGVQPDGRARPRAAASRLSRPRMCDGGVATWKRSSGPSPSAAHQCRVPCPIERWVWRTAFGQPVVPELNTSTASSLVAHLAPRQRPRRARRGCAPTARRRGR